jgi:hypothetical protein
MGGRRDAELRTLQAVRVSPTLHHHASVLEQGRRIRRADQHFLRRRHAPGWTSRPASTYRTTVD